MSFSSSFAKLLPTAPAASSIPRQGSPILEPLEPRLAPAGVVTVSLSPEGVLTLSGDAHDNDVHIGVNGDGTWTIRDLSDTGDPTKFRYKDIEGTLQLSFGRPLHSVKANLQGGADQLTLENLSLAGGVVVKDTAAQERDIFTLLGNTIHGPVTISTGGGDDAIELQRNHLSGHLTIHTGQAIDDVLLGEGSYKNITANLGGARSHESDGFHLYSLTGPITVLGDVLVRSSGQAETYVDFSSPELTILGDVDVRLTGGGNNMMNIGGPTGDVFIGGDVIYQGGGDGKQLRLGGTLVWDVNITIAGDLIYQADRNENYLIVKTSGTVTLGDIKIHSGKDIFYFDFQSGQAAIGSLDVRGNSYHSNISIAADQLWIAGDINVRNPVVPKSDTVGTGLDNYLNLSIAGDSVRVGGDLNVTSQTAEASIVLSANSGSIGNITYQGGKYGDYFRLQGRQYLEFQVQGDVNMRFANGSYSAIRVAGAVVHGDLTVRSGTHVANVPLEDQSNTVELADTVLFGDVSILQNDQVSGVVTVEGSTFWGRFTINTGGGNDHVWLTNLTNSFETNNTFHREVNVHLGSGTDILLLDDSAFAGEDIYRMPFRADGGSGSDTLYYFPGTDIFAITPVWLHFETQGAG